MGDRGNIIIRQDENKNTGDVWFYTHWSGYRMPETVQTALKRKQRWTDPAYLARIVFCELVKGNEAEETGFGISTGICDNEHDLIVVDVPGKRVAIVKSDDSPLPDKFTAKQSWTFDEYIALDKLPEV